MLRINFQESKPWVDSRGRTRSPLEQFRFLEPGGAQTSTLPVTLWEFGILSDGRDTTHSAKPRRLTSSLPPGYAVGYQEALTLGAGLRWVWEDLVPGLAGESDTQVFLSEPLEPSEVFRTVVSELTRVPGAPETYSGLLAPRALKFLLHHWWPSTLGVFAGVVPARNRDDAGDYETLRTTELPPFRHYFQTSSAYDNLGVAVLSPNTTWEQVKDTLRRQGWYAGRVVSTVPPQWSVTSR